MFPRDVLHGLRLIQERVNSCCLRVSESWQASLREYALYYAVEKSATKGRVLISFHRNSGDGHVS